MLSLKTKPGNYGLAQEGISSFMMEKHLPLSPIKTAKLSRTFGRIIEDKKGNIWFGADGLWRYDGSTFTKINQTGAGVIIEDKKGNILASIRGTHFPL